MSLLTDSGCCLVFWRQFEALSKNDERPALKSFG